jgi:aryl-alcohol dehydrogenase-like predicted oxidoreductase
VEQLKENLRALDALTLFTPEVVERVEGIVQNKPIPPAF